MLIRNLRFLIWLSIKIKASLMQLRDYLNFSVGVKPVPKSESRGTVKNGFIRYYKQLNNREYEEIIADAALSAMLDKRH